MGFDPKVPTKHAPPRKIVSQVIRMDNGRMAGSDEVLECGHEYHTTATGNGGIHAKQRHCGPKQLVGAAQDEEFDLEPLRKYGWVTKGGRLKRRR